MNVNDVRDDEVPSYVPGVNTRYGMIFERQRELMAKYHEIEATNGLLETGDCPVDLHDRFGQARIKNFAWRVTEEIAEATEARDHDEVHFIEELSDALHFLVELTILAGYGEEIIQAGPAGDDPLEWVCLSAAAHHPLSLSALAYTTIEQLGLMCNTLKNKPWKNTHLLTDTHRFYEHLRKAHVAFISLCVNGARLGPDEILRIYFKKSEVNKFRQRSNY